MPDHIDWGRREYRDALEAMRSLRDDRMRGAIPDTLVLVEHPAVYTVGVQGDEGEPFPPDVPVVHVERGGHVTYHGPGQLVGYPIVDLAPRGRDVRRHVHAVQDLVVDALAAWGLEGGRVPGQPGVWLDGQRKIASVGIAIEKWVSFHGFALNVDLDLSPFLRIRPCGLDGRTMTSMSTELEHPISIDEVKPAILASWTRRFGPDAEIASPIVATPAPAG